MRPFNKQNVINSVIVAMMAGLALGCQLYSQDYPKETAVIATMLAAFTTYLRLPVSGQPAEPPGGAMKDGDTIATGPPRI